jgi:hypothetical protein
MSSFEYRTWQEALRRKYGIACPIEDSADE